MSTFQADIKASTIFLYTSGIPELIYEDYEFVEHVADGGFGSVFKYRRRSDGQLVAMKFFGMHGCFKPVEREIEDEFKKDWLNNSMKSTARLYGYIVDSENGYVAHVQRRDLRANAVRGAKLSGIF
jgi:serine/threonine protein kinase